MQLKMSAKDARDNFTDLLGTVYYGKHVVEIKKKGRVFAVVLNPEVYSTLKQAAKGKFFQAVEEIQAANRGSDSSAVLTAVTREVEEVRQKQYEQRRSIQSNN